jgi:L-seryl-tRNA(Ser) seleniumtransferase
MTVQLDLYRKLPGVDELLHDAGLIALVSEEGETAVADACRLVIGHLREEISAGHLDSAGVELALSGVAVAVERQLRENLRYSLRPMINATGVILHTNLGRAPLSAAALEHIRETAGAYSNLEFDLESGERGKRDVHVDRLFRRLLAEESAELRSSGRARTPVPSPAISGHGAPSDELGGTGVLARRSERSSPAISTIVVNNNAAAVLLALNTLAEGGEVVVSRGELVEIGGSFRIPDVMGKSGAILREVGTTNRTRIADYESAINERTKLLLRVHRSNFEITGFTEQPSVAELIALAQKRKLPLMEDLGSGALFDLRTVGITDETGVLDSLRSGVHVVTYSGDKLLGGPQSGLISGREDLVKKMRGNSLFRALRVDKVTYAALEATLLAYAKRDYGAIPVLRMMELSKTEIAQRAEALVANLEKNLKAELVEGESLLGGGSAPSAVLATTLIALTCQNLSADQFAARLRASDPPVIARVEEGRVVLDLRTVLPEQDQALSQVLAQILPS